MKDPLSVSGHTSGFEPHQPSSGYDLVCADPIAREALHGWLLESRMIWPGRFRLTVTVSGEAPNEPDSREVLRQPTVAIQTGPPDGSVRVIWERAPAVAVIHPTLPHAEVWFSPAALPLLEEARRSFLLVVLVFMLRRLGWYHVHGAALVDPSGRGWLLAGDSRSGKSTTTALLASRGWGVGTDDIGFLVNRGSLVASVGFHSRIALRDGGRELLGTAGGLPLPHRDKVGFWPEELGGRWVAEVVPSVVAFPRLGERTSLVPMPPSEVLVSLVKWSQWVMYEPIHAQEHLDALGRVAAQARCFALTLGPDLFERPEMLQELAR